MIDADLILARLLALPEPQQLLFLAGLDDGSLRVIHRRWGLDNADSPLSSCAQQVILWLVWPRAFGDPAPPPAPSKALTRETKAVDLAERARAKRGLWHPKDYLSRSTDWDVLAALGAERQVHHLRSGHPVPGTLTRKKDAHESETTQHCRS